MEAGGDERVDAVRGSVRRRGVGQHEERQPRRARRAVGSPPAEGVVVVVRPQMAAPVRVRPRSRARTGRVAPAWPSRAAPPADAQGLLGRRIGGADVAVEGHADVVDGYSGSSGSPAVQPPSTGITCPVTSPAAGEHRNATTPATSRRLPDPPERDAPHGRPVHGLDLQHRRRHGRPDERRADRVHAHAVRRPVDGEAAGQRRDGPLRRGVGRLARQRHQRRLRGHEHDAAGAAPGSSSAARPPPTSGTSP